MITPDDIVTWVKLFYWPFVRIGAMVMAAPVFGAASVPVRIRIILAMALSVVVAPLIKVPPIDPVSLQGLIVSMHQIVIGAAMGFFMQLVFATTVLMGQSVAMSMGLGFASVVDPQNGVHVPVVSQFFLILATLLFLTMDGHIVMIGTLVESFNTFPIGEALFTPELMFKMVEWVGYVFLLALLMALPVMVAVLLVNLSFGVMTRAAPQLNIFAVGFPVTILLGFIIMAFTVSVFEIQTRQLFELGFESLTTFFTR